MTGELPFEVDVLDPKAQLERLQGDREAGRPSTRITTVADGLQRAQQRGVSPERLQRQLRADLDWIVMKAIAHDPERRYASAEALAQDLQRHLASEPVLAGPPTMGYRVNRFVARYRIQCVAAVLVIAAIVVGAVATRLQFVRAEENAAGLADKIREFDLLIGAVRVDEVVARSEQLVPAWPHLEQQLDAWLQTDCESLLAMRGDISATIRDLRDRALPRTAGQLERDRRSHPRYEELERLEQHVASFERARALARGQQQLVVPDVAAAVAELSDTELVAAAWQRISPEPDQRAVWGEEARGLAYAQAAYRRHAAADAVTLRDCDLLAWAWLLNGDADQAAAFGARALERAEGASREVHEVRLQERRSWLGDDASSFDELLASRAALRAEVDERRDWTFGDDQGGAGYLHDALVGLLEDLKGVEDVFKPRIEQRRRWASQLASLTFADPNARWTWDEARAAIAASDRYSGSPVELADDDVLGLVPIGENPATGLWEFYHLRSAWDGERDPAELSIPAHSSGGAVHGEEGLGVVFVLLPGGRAPIGAQAADPDEPGFDRSAHPSSAPVHEVELEPFWMARTELTQGQWARMWEGGTSERVPSSFRMETTVNGSIAVSESHPVEHVDWLQCERLLADHGLELPTEAQWEYGARAATDLPYWFQPNRPGRFENFSQSRCPAELVEGRLDDGFLIHAPVASLASNPFGLHDMLGNVREWCRDPMARYSNPVRAGDGYRVLDGARNGSVTLRVIRGGSFGRSISSARVWVRWQQTLEYRSNQLGFRAVRRLRPRERR